MPKSPLRLWLPTLVAIAPLLPQPLAARESGGDGSGESQKCMVWRLKGEKATVYIAGSIHILREEAYPLPAPYAAAYEDSSRLVFEIPPGEIDAPETAAKMQAAGTYPDEKTLDDHLDAETLKAVDAYLEKSGMPKMMKRYRPWMFSLVVSVVETMKLGAVPQLGIDHVYGEKAAKDKKETGGLETVEDQVAIFTGFTEKVQEQMLKKTLADVAEIGKEFDGMYNAWRTGDAEALYDTMFEHAEEFPEFLEALLLKRNRNWIDQIVGYIEGDENVMVIVGAGHLAGEGSVIDLLEKKGFKFEQLSYVPAAKKAEK